jgi:hypothetical protein
VALFGLGQVACRIRIAGCHRRFACLPYRGQVLLAGFPHCILQTSRPPHRPIIVTPYLQAREGQAAWRQQTGEAMNAVGIVAYTYGILATVADWNEAQHTRMALAGPKDDRAK